MNIVGSVKRSEMGKGKGNKERWKRDGEESVRFFFSVKALSKLSAGLWLEATIVISSIIFLLSKMSLLNFYFVFLFVYDRGWSRSLCLFSSSSFARYLGTDKKYILGL